MLMTIHKDFTSTDDIDSLYTPKKGDRGFANTEDCVEASIQVLEDYIKQSKIFYIAANNSMGKSSTDRKKSSRNRNVVKNNGMNMSSDEITITLKNENSLKS